VTFLVYTTKINVDYHNYHYTSVTFLVYTTKINVDYHNDHYTSVTIININLSSVNKKSHWGIVVIVIININLSSANKKSHWGIVVIVIININLRHWPSFYTSVTFLVCTKINVDYHNDQLSIPQWLFLFALLRLMLIITMTYFLYLSDFSCLHEPVVLLLNVKFISSKPLILAVQTRKVTEV
jgi:hypothetical protein